jgi:hypothetical protein
VWIATVALYGSLALMMAWKSSVRRWPSVFAYALFSTCFGILLYILFDRDCPAGYFWCYWIGNGIQNLLQFWILVAIVRKLIGVSDRWRRGVLFSLAGLGTVFLFLSAAVTLSVPSPFHLQLTRVVTSLDRCVSLAFCILFVFIAFSLDALGLRWRREVLLIGLGFAIHAMISTCFAWSITLFSISTAHWNIPSLIRDAVNLLAVAIWIAAFKPAAQPQVDRISDMSLSAALDHIENSTAHL